ncbi:hypothetical protein HK098_005431 [Nowakowskiella sp. JEL0407]|nr:hypothetical protein HK098_005431 [Nowakowskiella sp. JEL0407]
MLSSLSAAENEIFTFTAKAKLSYSSLHIAAATNNIELVQSIFTTFPSPPPGYIDLHCPWSVSTCRPPENLLDNTNRSRTTSNASVSTTVKDQSSETSLDDSKTKSSQNSVKSDTAEESDIYDALPINLAIIQGHVEMVNLLIQYGASLNKKDGRGRTPLICSIFGNLDSVIVTAKNFNTITTQTEPHQAICRNILHALIRNNRTNSTVSDPPSVIFAEVVNSPQDGAFLRGITPLCLSAYLGKEKLCTILLENGADVNSRDRNGASALMYAARDGHTRVVQCLVEALADVEATDSYGWKALQYGQSYPDIIKILENEMKNKASSSSIKKPTDPIKPSPFSIGKIKNGKVAKLRPLKVDTSMKYLTSNEELSALTAAPYSAAPSDAKVLFSPLTPTSETAPFAGETLHYNKATPYGSPNIKQNHSTLMSAIKQKDLHVFHTLLQSWSAAQLNAPDPLSGINPLQYACRTRPLSDPETETMIKMLLAQGCNVNARNPRSGKTSLHYVCRDPLIPPETPKIQPLPFKTSGKDKDSLSEKSTPASLSSTSSNSQRKIEIAAVRVLLQAGADPNIPDFDGNRPLHFAARCGCLEMVKVLVVEGKADVLLTNKKSKKASEFCVDPVVRDYLVSEVRAKVKKPEEVVQPIKIVTESVVQEEQVVASDETKPAESVTISEEAESPLLTTEELKKKSLSLSVSAGNIARQLRSPLDSHMWTEKELSKTEQQDKDNHKRAHSDSMIKPFVKSTLSTTSDTTVKIDRVSVDNSIVVSSLDSIHSSPTIRPRKTERDDKESNDKGEDSIPYDTLASNEDKSSSTSVLPTTVDKQVLEETIERVLRAVLKEKKAEEKFASKETIAKALLLSGVSNEISESAGPSAPRSGIVGMGSSLLFSFTNAFHSSKQSNQSETSVKNFDDPETIIQILSQGIRSLSNSLNDAQSRNQMLEKAVSERDAENTKLTELCKRESRRTIEKIQEAGTTKQKRQLTNSEIKRKSAKLRLDQIDLHLDILEADYKELSQHIKQTEDVVIQMKNKPEPDANSPSGATPVSAEKKSEFAGSTISGDYEADVDVYYFESELELQRQELDVIEKEIESCMQVRKQILNEILGPNVEAKEKELVVTERESTLERMKKPEFSALEDIISQLKVIEMDGGVIRKPSVSSSSVRSLVPVRLSTRDLDVEDGDQFTDVDLDSVLLSRLLHAAKSRIKNLKTTLLSVRGTNERLLGALNEAGVAVNKGRERLVEVERMNDEKEKQMKLMISEFKAMKSDRLSHKIEVAEEIRNMSKKIVGNKYIRPNSEKALTKATSNSTENLADLAIEFVSNVVDKRTGNNSPLETKLPLLIDTTELKSFKLVPINFTHSSLHQSSDNTNDETLQTEIISCFRTLNWNLSQLYKVFNVFGSTLTVMMEENQKQVKEILKLRKQVMLRSFLRAVDDAEVVAHDALEESGTASKSATKVLENLRGNESKPIEVGESAATNKLSKSNGEVTEAGLQISTKRGHYGEGSNNASSSPLSESFKSTLPNFPPPAKKVPDQLFPAKPNYTEYPFQQQQLQQLQSNRNYIAKQSESSSSQTYSGRTDFRETENDQFSADDRTMIHVNARIPNIEESDGKERRKVQPILEKWKSSSALLSRIQKLNSSVTDMRNAAIVKHPAHNETSRPIYPPPS